MHICSEMSLLAAWAPPNERSTLSAVAYGGTYVGTAITLILSGYLINAGVMGGWPSVFYLSGHATIIWFFLWSLLGFSSPADHPRISREEKAYLECTIGPKEVRESQIEFRRSQPYKANAFFEYRMPDQLHGGKY